MYRMGQWMEVMEAWLINWHESIKMEEGKKKGRLVDGDQASIDQLFMQWEGKGNYKRWDHELQSKYLRLVEVQLMRTR